MPSIHLSKFRPMLIQSFISLGFITFFWVLWTKIAYADTFRYGCIVDNYPNAASDLQCSHVSSYVKVGYSNVSISCSNWYADWLRSCTLSGDPISNNLPVSDDLFYRKTAPIRVKFLLSTLWVLTLHLILLMIPKNG